MVLTVRLVFTCDEVELGIVSRIVRALMALWKSKNQSQVVHRVISATQLDSEESEHFPAFSSDSAYVCCLRSSENQIVGVRGRSRRINQSQCTSPFVTGLVLLLLLVTLMAQFSLDHKWWSRKCNQNAFFTRS